jgi:hypothetical protein
MALGAPTLAGLAAAISISIDFPTK